MKRFISIFTIGFSLLLLLFSVNAFCGQRNNSFSSGKSFTLEKKHLNIAMILPLAYDKIGELDFNKFNIEEKKRSKYRCFEYITFYEGARIALDKLEKEGYDVSLYVYDVGEDDVNAMKSVLSLPEMKDMDLLIPLVFQKCFALATDFSNANHIPLVNPMSPNPLIVKNNPYVFKIQPSSSADVETVVRYIKNNYSNPNVILIFTPTEKSMMELYKSSFEREGWTWCGIDFNKYSRRIFDKMDSKKDNIFITIVDKGNNKANETYANSLLSLFNAKKGLPTINLIAQYNWLDFPSIDFISLQKYNFHFTLSYLNDYTNVNFVDFVKDYRKHFRQEPDKIYAALGYDIMMFFVPSMMQKGDKFISEPNLERSRFMVNSFFFDKQDPKDGWQNKRTVVYKINDYKIISVGR